MSNQNNSRENWERDIIERQHNLTPAEITRTSQFRGSGLPRSASLPISVRKIRVWGGAAICVLGIAIRITVDSGYSLLIGSVLAVAGLLLMLSAVRWTAK